METPQTDKNILSSFMTGEFRSVLLGVLLVANIDVRNIREMEDDGIRSDVNTYVKTLQEQVDALKKDIANYEDEIKELREEIHHANEK